MRLWHQSLIPYLDSKRLLGQHRECCALRGKGWGKKHSVVNYVFKHPYAWLCVYHKAVMDEMHHRKYNVTGSWYAFNYRGKNCQSAENNLMYDSLSRDIRQVDLMHVYPEHNDIYLKECLLNLQSKGAELTNGTCISEQLLKLAIEGRA